jgi:hypothetical protein
MALTGMGWGKYYIAGMVSSSIGQKKDSRVTIVFNGSHERHLYSDIT